MSSFLRLVKFSLMLQFLVLFSGCAFFGEEKANISNRGGSNYLEVPPDLISPRRDLKYGIPDTGGARLSDYGERTGTLAEGKISSVLPEVPGMRIKKLSNQRILIVQKEPKKIWPLLKSFWVDAGFSIESEVPETGLIETEWLEDRSKLPDDFIRSTLGKIFDQVYDTGERDKFRMRLERIEKEYSEISITHKGLIEIASNDRADPTVVWTNKTPDHQLEEIYLRRLMKYLGASEEESNAPTQTVRKDFVFLKTEKQIQFIQIDEDFPTAWRILSTAIDRVGFEVEDRARSDGKIYLKYTDGDNKIEKSFFSRIFSSDDNEQIARTYVVTIESSGKSSIVKVKPENESGSDATSQNIISIIFEQLV
ncbi:MAG: hypothetical protein CBC42_06665 [Betaproteobacteria bacterium TMED82]|nr:MAG: hypothetical protein CBC42_06665 [Betaproteobacteria bacterium TMED82]|tara:strand:+ start:8273 stop:9370 length:1098 start_codon:yes stop_codon:yes gene_type:complete